MVTRLTPGTTITKKFRKTVLIVSLLQPVYWSIPRLINVYDYPVLGAVYELSSLFMAIILFTLPLLCLVFWIKEKCSMRSVYIYSLIISLTSLLVIVTGK